MNLEGQIALINNPQEFTRLYNAVLKAEYGDDFLEIDDDRPDRGNDGYLKSERRIFAGHCFKRLQNQSIDREILDKMVGDLRKAIALKREGVWEISSWTFICNYPISERIARELVRIGSSEGIDVSWRGTPFIAGVLQRRPDVRARFPVLQVIEIAEQLARLEKKYEHASSVGGWIVQDLNDCPSVRELDELARKKPDHWEFFLFAGLMQRGKASLSRRLLDHEAGYAPRNGISLDLQAAIQRLSGALRDTAQIVATVNLIYTPEMQAKAFGEPGEPGNSTRIAHLAERTVGCAEELLSWAVKLRGTNVPDEAVEVFEAAARLVDQPLSEILRFIDDYATTTAKIPELIEAAQGEPVALSQHLTITMDPKAISRFSESLQRVGALRGEGQQ